MFEESGGSGIHPSAPLCTGRIRGRAPCWALSRNRMWAAPSPSPWKYSWPLDPSPRPFSGLWTGRQWLGSEGPPFRVLPVPCPSSFPLGPGEAHIRGTREGRASHAKLSFSLRFPRLSQLSVYIRSILSHQDSATCRRIRRIETKCGARERGRGGSCLPPRRLSASPRVSTSSGPGGAGIRAF